MLTPTYLSPFFNYYGYKVAFNFFLSLGSFICLVFLVWNTGSIFIFCLLALFFRSAIMFIRLDHTLKCRHGFLHVPLQPMELEKPFLLYYRTSLLSWVMAFSITIRSTWEFRRLSTSGNTYAKLDYNGLGFTGSCYSSNPFQYVKVVSSSSSVPHEPAHIL